VDDELPPFGVDWGKMILSLSTLAAVVALTLANHLDDTAAAGFIGTIVGYVYGNGKAARRGEPMSPMLFRRERRDLEL
jgi:hypothetical protein